VASAQGIANVFNPSCVPSKDEEKELFVKQQKFGCQVLKQTTLASLGMDVVHEHSQTKQAQIACTKRHKTGMQAPKWQQQLETNLNKKSQICGSMQLGHRDVLHSSLLI
jgi:hypothetical protein